MHEARNAAAPRLRRQPPGARDMNGLEGQPAALDVEAHRIDGTPAARHGRSERGVVADIGAHAFERRAAFEQHGAAFGMARRQPHGKTVGEQMAHDAPAEKSGAAEDYDAARAQRA